MGACTSHEPLTEARSAKQLEHDRADANLATAVDRYYQMCDERAAWKVEFEGADLRIPDDQARYAAEWLVYLGFKLSGTPEHSLGTVPDDVSALLEAHRVSKRCVQIVKRWQEVGRAANMVVHESS